jgi:hypothetical protein
MRKQRTRFVFTPRAGTLGIVLLTCSSVLVGAAISADGSIGRLLNGVGAIGWLVSIPVLVNAARREQVPGWIWPLCIGFSAVIAFLVRPSDIVLATVAFSAAGSLVGWNTRPKPAVWGALVAACYLPAHVGAALLKAAGRALFGVEATIRTEPPPTAEIVPLVIVVTAVTSAVVANRIRVRRTTTRRRASVQANRLKRR